MLKANVGLSRKLSENFQSTGFSLNLEGEIHAALDDPESVIERIKELYSVAEEALDRQISESREIDNFAGRDADDRPQSPDHGPSNGHAPKEAQASSRNGHHDGKPAGVGEPASNKQVAFLQNLAKRQKLFGAKLEGFIEEVLGRRCSPYDLTKKEAGAVIDALNPEEAGDNRPRR
jgi:hypothetical protein